MPTDLFVYIVSLTGAVERRERVTKEFVTAGIPFQFFDAINGANVEIESKIDRAAILRNQGRNLSAGEIGCCLSHRAIYRQIIDRNLPGAFVFEDDVEVEDGALRVMRLIADLMYANNDRNVVIHLQGERALRDRGTLLSRKSRIRLEEEFSLNRYLRGQDVYGTWGYYISRAAATNVLQDETLVTNVADCWKYWVQRRTVAEFFLLARRLVVHPPETQGSDLQADRTRMYLEANGTSRQKRPMSSRIRSAAARLVYPVLSRLI